MTARPRIALFLGRLAPDELLRPFLSFGAWQMLGKLSRLFVVIALARSLDATAVGIAALALSIGDMLKSLTENGAGQRVIAATADRLEDTARGAMRYQTLWIAGLMVLQAALASVLWLWFDKGLVGAMIAVLLIEYLVIPRSTVAFGLAMRDPRRAARVAGVQGLQIAGANLLTAAMLLLWAHPMSMILPRVIAAPIFLWGILRLAPWRMTPGPRREAAHFLRYSIFVVLTEASKIARQHIDKLLIGGLMGTAALGEYFFAFNAGLGLATSFSVALGTAIFPLLSRADDRDDALRRGLRLALIGVAPVVLLQALAAPVYVPLLFSDRWAHIAPVVSVLCLAAIPLTLWAAIAQYHRSNDRPEVETHVSLAMVAAISVSTLALAPFGLMALAVGYVAATTFVCLAASLPVLLRLRGGGA